MTTDEPQTRDGCFAICRGSHDCICAKGQSGRRIVEANHSGCTKTCSDDQQQPSQAESLLRYGQAPRTDGQANQKEDNEAIEALSAKADSLVQQIGPEYVKMMEGLDEVDPDSDEGKQFAAVFGSLDKQCK